jgi:uncharacterized protein YjiS (DUF1127 family)
MGYVLSPTVHIRDKTNALRAWDDYKRSILVMSKMSYEKLLIIERVTCSLE